MPGLPAPVDVRSEAVESSGAEGLWAGVVIPEGGRARAYALGQLRSLAERNGYPVRERRGRPDRCRKP